jgi:hypothetical protein
MFGTAGWWLNHILVATRFVVMLDFQLLHVHGNLHTGRLQTVTYENAAVLHVLP